MRRRPVATFGSSIFRIAVRTSALFASTGGRLSERVTQRDQRPMPLAVVAARASVLTRSFVAVAALAPVNRRTSAVSPPVLVDPVGHATDLTTLGRASSGAGGLGRADASMRTCRSGASIQTE